jgi:peptidoglycan/xylan/chitin deacetylase (PgdA/CDA1 family)
MVLAHTAPAPFLLDALARERALWHMPATDPPTVYLTFDDGPNPTTTPDLLDVLAHENVRATFFLIDRHITADTAPIVRRMLAEGHAVGVHTESRKHLLSTPSAFAAMVTEAAAHIERIAGEPPCRLFRPHAGWRSGSMFEGLRRIDYRLVGWSWMLWDWNWFRKRTADSIVHRIAHRASAGDIIVVHDGDEKAPTSPQRQTVEATARLIPILRAKGLQFAGLCEGREETTTITAEPAEPPESRD